MGRLKNGEAVQKGGAGLQQNLAMIAQGQDEQECVIGAVRDAVRDDLLFPSSCSCSPDSQRWFL